MKLTMTQEKKTVIADAGMHPYAFVNACKLAEKLGGEACSENKRFKATFKSVKKATQFVTEWNAQYEQAQANKTAKDEPKPKKVATGKGKKPTASRKPKSAKGNAKMTKKEVRSWAWKEANGDRAKYDELCKSKGVDNHR